MANANYTSVGAATNACQLLPNNLKRGEVIITNTSTATLYIGFNRVSATDFAVALPYLGTFVTSTTDQIKGLWSSAAGGQANVTEIF